MPRKQKRKELGLIDACRQQKPSMKTHYGRRFMRSCKVHLLQMLKTATENEQVRGNETVSSEDRSPPAVIDLVQSDDETENHAVMEIVCSGDETVSNGEVELVCSGDNTNGAEAELVRSIGNTNGAKADLVCSVGNTDSAEAELVRSIGNTNAAEADLVCSVGNTNSAEADLVCSVGNTNSAEAELVSSGSNPNSAELGHACSTSNEVLDDSIIVLSSTLPIRPDDSVIFLEEIKHAVQEPVDNCTIVYSSLGSPTNKTSKEATALQQVPKTDAQCICNCNCICTPTKSASCHLSQAPAEVPQVNARIKKIRGRKKTPKTRWHPLSPSAAKNLPGCLAPVPAGGVQRNGMMGPLIPFNPGARLRPIIIDGSNVARTHGQKSGTYSCKGIALCISYFQGRGHKQVTAFVPQFRRNRFQVTDQVQVTDQWMLETLAKSQTIVFTPSRMVNGRLVASYDDRFMVDLACQNGGVLISNDNFRDIAQESEEWRRTIEQRLLMYCFVGDIFMVPQDPCGRRGPRLTEFLSF